MKVSVVIPTFNRATYLVEALRSVFAQTFTEYEVIVVDDGSTDDTAEALAPFRDRIQYLRQENRGGAAARNTGVAQADGEWVAFLDSDDMWETHTLETLLEAAKRFPAAGVIAMRGRDIRSDGARTDRVYGKRTPGPYFTTKTLLWGDSGGVLTPIVRRSLFQEVGGFDATLRAAHDCDLWLRLSFQTQMVGVREPLLLRRVHDEHLSGDRALNARMWLRILAKLQQEHPDFPRRHPLLWRRSLAKQDLRLGRELLAHAAGDPAVLRESAAHLRRAVRTYPFFLRAWVYLTWNRLAPSTYRFWRRGEQGVRLRPKPAVEEPARPRPGS